MSLKISKTEFKKDVMDNCRRLFRKELDEATPQEQYQSVSYAVKDMIVENWIATQKQLTKDDPKIVYYMSMEFLMGRALGNNLINLTFYDEVKEALEEIGLDLNTIEDQVPNKKAIRLKFIKNTASKDLPLPVAFYTPEIRSHNNE